MNDIAITNYSTADRPQLLALLLQLQSSYFQQVADARLQELDLHHDIEKAYQDYLEQTEPLIGDNWQIYLAKNTSGKMVGFIIGSVEADEGLVYGTIGKVEDWYVEPELRGQGIGRKLYLELEKWFTAKGCSQVQSETWQGNQLSIDAHLKSGFFVSEVRFRKKIGG